MTFALPGGAAACLAEAEPTLGRRAANLLLCRRAASSQLLKGEPVIVVRCALPLESLAVLLECGLPGAARVAACTMQCLLCVLWNSADATGERHF